MMLFYIGNMTSSGLFHIFVSSSFCFVCFYLRIETSVNSSQWLVAKYYSLAFVCSKCHVDLNKSFPQSKHNIYKAVWVHCGILNISKNSAGL